MENILEYVNTSKIKYFNIIFNMIIVSLTFQVYILFKRESNKKKYCLRNPKEEKPDKQ